MSTEDVHELSQSLLALRDTLYAEASGLVAYVVVDKRVDVNKLLNNMSALLAPNVFDALTNVAKHDMTEAGKCIAFNRPTAAAFHVLRATESILRDFYKTEVKRNRIKSEMWGEIVADLRRRKKGPQKALLDNLDNIRSNFRNPTQHPEKVYDIEECQDLLSLCIDVINRMVLRV